MKKVNLLLVLLVLLFACETEPDNLTVLLNQSGTLSIKVIDNNDVFKGAKLSIYSSIPENERIYFDSTDASGTCNVGKILQGQYEYYISAIKNNKTYVYSEYFQIIAGDDKTIETNPFLNIGNVSIKIVDLQSVPIQNVNVALIPHPIYSNEDYIFNDLIKEAYFIGITDIEGWVRFESVPVGMDYSTLVYFDANNYIFPAYNNYVYVYRNTERKYTMKVDL